MSCDHLKCFLGLEDELAGDHKIGNAAQRINVGASIDRLAERHLWRHVRGRTERHLTRSRSERSLYASARDLLDQAEIEDLHKVVAKSDLSQVDVCRLDVPVHEPQSVRLLQGIAHLSKDVDHATHW